jgi:hypothetical protein
MKIEIPPAMLTSIMKSQAIITNRFLKSRCYIFSYQHEPETAREHIAARYPAFHLRLTMIFFHPKPARILHNVIINFILVRPMTNKPSA